MLKVPHRCVAVAVLLGLLATLKSAVAGQERDGLAIQRDIPSLYQSLAGYFPMGAAIWQGDISGAHSELLTRHFNSITAENAMKWAVIEPSEGHFNFAPADALVEFAKANHMRVRGHTLCWHKQLPTWVFEDSSGKQMTPSPENKAFLLRRLENHIRAVVAHYKNDVYAWDVVNEVIDPAQRDGFRRSPWFLIAGRDYIDAAFRVAHEVSPEAKLYINDYDTTDLPKRTFLYKLVRDLRGRGVPVDGVGHQMHSTIKAPSAAAVVKTIDLFSSLAVDNQITELDVSVYTDETSRYATIPDELLLRQGNQYRAYFDAFRKLKGKISSVTLWGLADDHTWKKGFPIRRLDLPLLFDEQLQTKPAFWAIVDPAHLPLSRASADDATASHHKNLQ